MKTVALIMAGGRGERFWPRSRRGLPKQFLSVTEDGMTLLQKTVKRIEKLIPAEDIYICTNVSFAELVTKQLPDVPSENVIFEPVGKNTAPCIGLAAVYIEKRVGDAVMLVFPSDHVIRDEDLFVCRLKEACAVAEQGENLVTLGIEPAAPETGYGYICFDEGRRFESAYAVERFEEKPDYDTALSYVESGKYLWNSGIFAWKLSAILGCFEKFLPDMYKRLLTIREAIGTKDADVVCANVYSRITPVSIDYGIMENAESLYVIKCDFDWDDVGSWLALERLNPRDENGNVFIGNVSALATENCTAQTPEGKKTALIGLKDVVVVDTEDVLLISDKAKLADIKEMLKMIRENGQEEYL